MKVNLNVTATEQELEMIGLKERELTKENIIIFNSDETAQTGAILEMVYEYHDKDLFSFLKNVSSITLNGKSIIKGD